MRNKHPLSVCVLILASFLALSFRPGKDGEDLENSHASREFCGKITYTVILESKCPLLDTHKLQEMYGNTMVMYIKNGAYKMVYNGTAVKEVLYLGEQNKQFFVMDQSDSLLWRTCRKIKHADLRTYSRRMQSNVLDRNCDAFSIENDWSTTTYLFDPHMKLNPRYFRDHGFDYFNTYLRHARAPYLKCVYDGPDYKKTLIATEIEETDLSDDIFTVNDMPLVSNEL